jgi:methylglyoxal synthase
LIAHDERKDALVTLLRPYRDRLSTMNLIATGHTGAKIADELGLDVERLRSGPEGGDVQIGARLVDGQVDALIFLRDPLTAHPHEPDIQALLKLVRHPRHRRRHEQRYRDPRPRGHDRRAVTSL